MKKICLKAKAFDKQLLQKLLIMSKLSLLLFACSVFTIHAETSYSQQVKLNLEMKNASLTDLIYAIKNQTDFEFAYDTNLESLVLDKVSINAKNEQIEKVLASILKGTDIDFKVFDKIILLSKSKVKITPGLENSIAVQQQQITGTISDASTGEPLPGVNITVEGTTLGTVSDENGRYTINVPSANSVLVFSFVGYVSEKAETRDKSVIDVKLTADIKSLEEVVVVGYGTQKSATLTGSVSEVKGKEFIKSPQPNVSNSLAGRVSGVIANNRSGEPGYDGSTYYIRGMSTTGNNDVLVVIDGVPGQIGGLDRLDPNDIATITVLKDASAAVYGSRAANGAILITTKRGATGKPVLSYSFNQGFSQPTRLPGMADASTYATIRNEIEYYNNKAGGMNQVYSNEEIQKFRDGSDPLNYPNTDWQKETLKKFAVQNQHSLSIAGGTEQVKYFASIGTLYQDGIYKKGVTNYRQYNVRTNVDANITRRLKVGLNLSGRQEDRKFPISSAGNIFRSIYRAYPTLQGTYPNGLPSTGIENNNPVVLVTDLGGTVKNPTYIINGSLKGRYDIPFVEGLSFEAMLAADKSFNFNKSFNTPYSLYNYNKSTGSYDKVVTGGSSGKARLDQSQDNISLVTSNIRLNYEKQFGKHSINSFFIYEQSARKQEYFSGMRLNYPTTQTPELSQGGSAATDKDNSGWSSEFTRRSYIGKLAYNFSEKYLLEAQFRVDGSSIFPEGKQYGFFPSVSAGWRISEEGWFKNNISFFDQLKLRVSYGVLGNDNVNPFQFYNNYSFVNSYVIGTEIHPGIDLVKLANPNITWEKAKKLDIGFNANFLQNFSAEFIYFKQQRSDILAARNASIPGTSGIVNPFNDGSSSYTTLVPSENFGKVNNNGFEVSLGYSKKGNFSYNFGVNATYAKSEIIDIDEASGVLSHQKQTGRPLNTSLLYKAIGIFRTEGDLNKYPHLANAQLGDLILEDYTKDGKITADDMVRSDYGNVPELVYGINMGAAWKSIDVSLIFTGQSRVRNYVLFESGNIGNFYSSWADNRWSPANTEGSYPRVDTRASSSINGGLNPNTFWFDNSSFIRLKNISVGYTLPESLISRINLSSARIYINAFNLFTLTKVKDYDPEGNSSSGQFYPQQRIYNIGLNVNF